MFIDFFLRDPFIFCRLLPVSQHWISNNNKIRLVDENFSQFLIFEIVYIYEIFLRLIYIYISKLIAIFVKILKITVFQRRNVQYDFDIL